MLLRLEESGAQEGEELTVSWWHVSFGLENMFLNYGSSLLSSCLSTRDVKTNPTIKLDASTKKEKETRNHSSEVSHSPSFLEEKLYKQYCHIEKY